MESGNTGVRKMDVPLFKVAAAGLPPSVPTFCSSAAMLRHLCEGCQHEPHAQRVTDVTADNGLCGGRHNATTLILGARSQTALAAEKMCVQHA